MQIHKMVRKFIAVSTHKICHLRRVNERKTHYLYHVLIKVQVMIQKLWGSPFTTKALHEGRVRRGRRGGETDLGAMGREKWRGGRGGGERGKGQRGGGDKGQHEGDFTDGYDGMPGWT